MIRHYIIDTKEESIRYYLDQYVDFKTAHDVYRLSYSKSDCWSEHVREETILTVTNDGNGFKVKWEEKPEKNRLDYSQMRELQMVLSFIQKTDAVDNKVMLLKHDELNCL
jgi:hypothetical protein